MKKKKVFESAHCTTQKPFFIPLNMLRMGDRHWVLQEESQFR